jgi:PleD family two-component response regulator
VDDNAANLLSLRAILEDLGHNLVEARSGEDALQRVRSDEFAVVLLDVLVPGMSGFETANYPNVVTADACFSRVLGFGVVGEFAVPEVARVGPTHC